MNRLCLIGLVVMAAIGCRQEILVLPDATSTDGSADGGRLGDTGRFGDGGPDSDAGGFDAAGSDLGPRDGGEVGFTIAEFPLTGALNRSIRVIRVVDSENVTVVFGNSSGFLGIVDDNGPRQGWRTEDNSAIRAIERTSWGIAVLSQRGVFEFNSGDYLVPTGVTPISADALDMSLLDDEGFVSADVNNGQRLYSYANNQLTAVADLLPGRANTILTVGPAEVYLGGYGGIRRYKSGALTEMAVDWPAVFDSNDIASFQVLEIGRVEDEVHAVGSWQSILRLEGDTWRFVHQGMEGYDFGALANGHFYGGESPGTAVMRQGPEPFSPIELPNRSYVLCLDYSPISGYLWVGGYERSGIDGRLFRLSRP